MPQDRNVIRLLQRGLQEHHIAAAQAMPAMTHDLLQRNSTRNMVTTACELL
jgi:hypothetical protein